MPRGRAPLTVVVLAAGQGVRMRSRTIKLLHPVAGRPMIALALDTVQALSPSRVITVVGFQADRVREALNGYRSAFVLQKEQRGTGHAVLQAAREIGSSSRSTLLIVNGFIEPFTKELPMEYAVELNRLIEMEMEGSVG